MGHETFSRTAYKSKAASFNTNQPVTQRGAEVVRKTGKLHEMVDPSKVHVIRPSWIRLGERPDGLFEVLVGPSMAIETRLDTTGSMGGNVNVAFRVLPDMFESCQAVLPGFDVHIATGIFGDVEDDFVLCRPQFEMHEDKIINQLSLMNPERGGAGNGGEDPHYGLFGGAYLCDHRIRDWGLKSYDFTVTDEPARDYLDKKTLERVYGDEVFDYVAKNGWELDPLDLPDTKQVVTDLLKGAHAFLIEVGDRYGAHAFWSRMYGAERVVRLDNIEYLPQMQAMIIGLTEGVLSLNDDCEDFLTRWNVPASQAKQMVKAVSHIPLGVGDSINKFHTLPQKGDLFRTKKDLWPIKPEDVPVDGAASISTSGGSGEAETDWL